jgi:hypothetical protein
MRRVKVIISKENPTTMDKREQARLKTKHNLIALSMYYPL